MNDKISGKFAIFLTSSSVLVCHILVLCIYIFKGVAVHFMFHVCHGKSIFLPFLSMNLGYTWDNLANSMINWGF